MAITIGATTEIDASGSADMDVCMLTDSLAMILYEDTGGTFKARTISVSGSTLTPNAEVTVNTASQSGVECKLVRLTSTSAMAIYLHQGLGFHIGARVLTVSGTTITVNAETTLSNQPAGTGRFSAAFLSSTQVIYVYGDLADSGTSGNARILSVSGTAITENAETEIVSSQFNCQDVTYLSSTKAIVSWINTASGTGDEFPKAAVLTVSGTTISVGSITTIESVQSTIFQHRLTLVPLTSSIVAHAYINGGDSSIRLHILTVSGTSISAGAVTVVSTTSYSAMDSDALNSSNFVLHVDTGSNFRVLQFSVSGTTITLEDEEVGEASVNELSAIAALSSTSAIAAFQGSVDGYIITFTGTGISGSEFTSGLLTARPADIDMDGSFIYIGALASDGAPILIKFSTALNADGSIVFQPGAGTDIGVQCGRKDADIVWVAGNFGASVVQKSEDAGANFSVKDSGFSPVTSFAVGPDSDERVLIFADAGGSVVSTSIYETIDDGASWEQKNSGLGFVSKAVERLDVNPEELISGNEAATSDNIDYSPNSGENLEDYSTGFPEVDVTSLVVG